MFRIYRLNMITNKSKKNKGAFFYPVINKTNNVMIKFGIHCVACCFNTLNPFPLFVCVETLCNLAVIQVIVV